MEQALTTSEAKHAYLILAHGQYELLHLLVSSIDDPRNDIYIHLDIKAGEIPSHIQTSQARLTWIPRRLDVRWGDVSIAEAEYELFAVAQAQGKYAYYHLLSGVDLPLKSQDYIHEFFAQHAGKEFVGYYHGEDLEASLLRKVRRRHLFPKHFRGKGLSFQMRRVIRALYLKLQEQLGITRNDNIDFHKGTQWVSITDALVRELLEHRDEILSLYRGSFCCDEVFIQTYLASSPLSANIYDIDDEARGCMREIGWADGVLTDFGSEDLEKFRKSEALFARKFNESDMDFLHEVLRHE